MNLPRPLLLVAALAGCTHAPPPPPAATAEIAPLPAPSAAPPLPTTATSATEPPPADPEEAPIDCSDEAFAARMKEVTQAEKQADRDAILGAIERALVVRPRDPGLWTRRARIHLQARATDEIAQDGRVLVEINEGVSALGWLLRGIAAEDQKQPAEARAYLARSALQDPQGEAVRRLGSRSRCTAIAYRPTKDDKLPLVRGWMGVFGVIDPIRMVPEELPAPKTEAEARERTCIHGNLSEITDRHVCQGKAPWMVQTGHMHFHDMQTLIQPLPRHRFALVNYSTGLGCRGGSESSVRLRGEVIEVQTNENTGPIAPATECDSSLHDPLSIPCIAAVEHTTTYYDATTGQALLTLDDRNASETHEIKGHRLRRTGPAGCDETLDLRRLPPDLGPRPGP
jgi:hypothetical protein